MRIEKGLGLGDYLHLGTRNLWRNPRRTVITLTSLVVGIAGLTFLGALNDGWLEDMRTNFILSLTGHVQIHSLGIESAQDLSRRIDDPEPIADALAELVEAAAWTYRLRTSGLASVPGMSRGIQIIAVDPTREQRVTRLGDCLEEGDWLDDTGPNATVLGSGLARQLGVGAGDRIVLMAQRPGGDMASEAFRVAGVLCPGAPQVDRTLTILSLRAAGRWLETGASVTDIVVRARENDLTTRLVKRIRSTLPPGLYKVVPWQEQDPVIGQWVKFSDAYGIVVILIVVALVVLGTLNTMLMALHERSRELAVMHALGTRPVQLFNMILIEGLLLVLLGSTLGYGLGATAIFAIAEEGVDLSRFADAFGFFYMNPVIHPLLRAETELRIVGTTLASALLAGVYPAIKASRIEPSEVLRGN